MQVRKPVLKNMLISAHSFFSYSSLFSSFTYFFPFFLSEFDRHEILLYEEVAKVPPFKRKTLILIGAQGVGRRRLKNKLLLRDPLLFGTTIPCTKSDILKKSIKAVFVKLFVSTSYSCY